MTTRDAVHPNAPAFGGGAGAFRSAGSAGTSASFEKRVRPGPLGMAPPAALSAAPAIDRDKAANYMHVNAHGTDQFTGHCARACRLGLEAGGLNTTGHPGLAKEWASYLEKLRVPVVARNSLDGYQRTKGDVAVFEGG